MSDHLIPTDALNRLAAQRKALVERLGVAPERLVPSVVYLLIDLSGSMAERGKLGLAKKGAVEFACDAESKSYRVGCISFSSWATVVVRADEDNQDFASRIASLQIGGGTDMALGIRAATAEFHRIAPCRAKVIAMVTDGQPDSRMATLEAAAAAKLLGIEILTLGTEDADHSFLRQLASRTDLALAVPSSSLQVALRSLAGLLPQSSP